MWSTSASIPLRKSESIYSYNWTLGQNSWESAVSQGTHLSPRELERLNTELFIWSEGKGNVGAEGRTRLHVKLQLPQNKKFRREKTTFKMHDVLIKCLLWTLQTSKFLPRTPNKSLEAWGTLDSFSAPRYSKQEARGWEALFAIISWFEESIFSYCTEKAKGNFRPLLCQQINKHPLRTTSNLAWEQHQMLGQQLLAEKSNTFQLTAPSPRYRPGLIFEVVELSFG